MTRFEKIKGMTIEELSKKLAEYVTVAADYGIYNDEGDVKTWLESEVDDE